MYSLHVYREMLSPASFCSFRPRQQANLRQSFKLCLDKLKTGLNQFQVKKGQKNEMKITLYTDHSLNYTLMTMSLNDRLTSNLSQYDHDLTGFRHEFVPWKIIYRLVVWSVSINAHIHVFEYKPIWFKASD